MTCDDDSGYTLTSMRGDSRVEDAAHDSPANGSQVAIEQNMELLANGALRYLASPPSPVVSEHRRHGVDNTTTTRSRTSGRGRGQNVGQLG